MSTSLDSIGELIDSHGMTLADLEFIIKYLVRENISPQLAMRRIKSFDVLKEKLEDNTDQDVIKELKEQLSNQEKSYQEELAKKEQELKQKIEEKENYVKSLINEKTSLEDKNAELQNLSELFDSERDELRNQLKLIQDLSPSETEENPMKSAISQMADLISYVGANHDDIEPIFKPIVSALLELDEDNSEVKLNRNKFNKQVGELVKQLRGKKGEVSNSKSSSLRKQQSTPAQKQTQTPTNQKNDSNKQETIVKQEKTVDKPNVDENVIQVLNLFLDFLKEADNNKNFQDRVSTICEMDEAYEHLGSIGLSQVYSFVSKDISKKPELVKLIESWKVDGVPR